MKVACVVCECILASVQMCVLSIVRSSSLHSRQFLATWWSSLVSVRWWDHRIKPQTVFNEAFLWCITQ